MVKNPPAVQETQVQSLGQEGPLGKGMATHSSILARRIPWPEEVSLVGYSPQGHKELDTTERLNMHTHRPDLPVLMRRRDVEGCTLIFSCENSKIKARC